MVESELLAAETDSNSSLSTYRRCNYLYYLEYELGLEPIGEPVEALDVGTCWHAALEAKANLEIEIYDHDAKSGHPSRPLISHAPVEAGVIVIDRTAPSTLWREKLRRMFVLHDWHWKEHTQFRFLEAEHVFAFPWKGHGYRGKSDGTIIDESGRIGIFEAKTTGGDIGDGALFWSQKRLDPQPSMYGKGMLHSELARVPDFIVYDAVRKPGIKQKQITKADAKRMLGEIAVGGKGQYCNEPFDQTEILLAIEMNQETVPMYGARLSQEIIKKPEWYFQRKEIPRTGADYARLDEQLRMQASAIRSSRERGEWPQNSDSCDAFSRCRMLGRICEPGIEPKPGDVPEGFRVRDNRHPELDGETQA